MMRVSGIVCRKEKFPVNGVIGRSVLVSVVALFFLAGCGDLWVPLSKAIDTTPPIINTATCNPDPTVASSVDQQRNIAITIGFSEQMDPSTINSSTFTITDTTASTGVSGAITYDSLNDTATFTPSSPFTGGHSYTVTLDGNVTDAGGNIATGLPFSYTFTAQTFAVAGTTPVTGATGVLPSQTVTVTFNEPVNDSALSATVSSWASVTDSNGSRTISSATWNAAKTVLTLTLGDTSGYLSFNKPTNPSFVSTVSLAGIPSSVDGVTLSPSVSFTMLPSWEIFASAFPVDLTTDVQSYVLRNGTSSNVYLVWEYNGTIRGRMHDGTAWAQFIPSPFITSVPASAQMDAVVDTSTGSDVLIVGYVNSSGLLQFYYSDGSTVAACNTDATLSGYTARSLRLARDASTGSLYAAFNDLSGQSRFYKLSWNNATKLLSAGTTLPVGIYSISMVQFSLWAGNGYAVYGQYDGTQSYFYYTDSSLSAAPQLGSTITGKTGGSVLISSSGCFAQYLGSTGNMVKLYSSFPPSTVTTTPFYSGSNSVNSSLSLIASPNAFSAFIDATTNTLVFYTADLSTGGTTHLLSSAYNQPIDFPGVSDWPVRTASQPEGTNQIILACVLADSQLHVFRSW